MATFKAWSSVDNISATLAELLVWQCQCWSSAAKSERKRLVLTHQASWESTPILIWETKTEQPKLWASILLECLQILNRFSFRVFRDWKAGKRNSRWPIRDILTWSMGYCVGAVLRLNVLFPLSRSTGIDPISGPQVKCIQKLNPTPSNGYGWIWPIPFDLVISSLNKQIAKK